MPTKNNGKNVRAWQARTRARGLCTAGCGAPTEINPKTGQHFWKCYACERRHTERRQARIVAQRNAA